MKVLCKWFGHKLTKTASVEVEITKGHNETYWRRVSIHCPRCGQWVENHQHDQISLETELTASLRREVQALAESNSQLRAEAQNIYDKSRNSQDG